MTTTQIRIQELSKMIAEILTKENSVENAATWARLQKERSELKNK
jgi:hypothetical protein